MGFFDKLKAGLTRTKQQILDRFDELVQRADAPEQRTRQIDVDTIEALEEILIGADIGVAATERIVTVGARAASRQGESLRDLVKQEIRQIFDAVAQPPASNGQPPHVTLIVGVNGTGKTTTIGKLANLMKKSGRQPLVCAADTFRAAAVEQLEVWAGARRRGHRAREGRVGPGGGRVRRDPVGQGARPRSDPGRHRRPAAHPRQPDERARQDPARRRPRGRRRAARGAARARRHGRAERAAAGARSSRRWPASPASC